MKSAASNDRQQTPFRDGSFCFYTESGGGRFEINDLSVELFSTKLKGVVWECIAQVFDHSPTEAFPSLFIEGLHLFWPNDHCHVPTLNATLYIFHCADCTHAGDLLTTELHDSYEGVQDILSTKWLITVPWPVYKGFRSFDTGILDEMSNARMKGNTGGAAEENRHCKHLTSLEVHCLIWATKGRRRE